MFRSRDYIDADAAAMRQGGAGQPDPWGRLGPSQSSWGATPSAAHNHYRESATVQLLLADLDDDPLEVPNQREAPPLSPVKPPHATGRTTPPSAEAAHNILAAAASTPTLRTATLKGAQKTAAAQTPPAHRLGSPETHQSATPVPSTSGVTVNSFAPPMPKRQTTAPNDHLRADGGLTAVPVCGYSSLFAAADRTEWSARVRDYFSPSAPADGRPTASASLQPPSTSPPPTAVGEYLVATVLSPMRLAAVGAAAGDLASPLPRPQPLHASPVRTRPTPAEDGECRLMSYPRPSRSRGRQGSAPLGTSTGTAAARTGTPAPAQLGNTPRLPTQKSLHSIEPCHHHDMCSAVAAPSQPLPIRPVGRELPDAAATADGPAFAFMSSGAVPMTTSRRSRSRPSDFALDQEHMAYMRLQNKK